MSSAARIRKHFEDHDIQRVKIGGFDIDGVLRGKYISLEKFWSIVDGGMGFCDVIFGWDIADQLYDRPGITGWHTGYPDTAAKIDLETFRMIPWEPGTASFILDFEDDKGTPSPASPRQLLKRVLQRADEMGYAATCAVEYEFFIYDETPRALAERGYHEPKPMDRGMFGYSWLRTSEASTLMHALLEQTAAYDVLVEGLHTETGPGVFEAALRYSDAQLAADRAALFKTIVKEICLRHDVMASFMAKPQRGMPGCSGHTHQSLRSQDGD